MRYNKLGVIDDKDRMKQAILDRLDFDQIADYRPTGIAKFVYYEMFLICEQEVWEETELFKTNIGELLYV